MVFLQIIWKGIIKVVMGQKHLIENNKMAFFCLLLVHACAFVMGFLYHKYLDYPRVIYYLLVVIGISTTLVGRLKFVESHKGHMIMLGGVALTYLVLLFSFYKKPFLYALTYLICVTIMLYRDKHMLTLGLIVACIGNFGITLLYFLCTDKVLAWEVLTNDVFAVCSMIIAYAVVARMNRQTKDLLTDVHTKAELQAKESDRVKDIAHNISEQLNTAKQ